MWSDYGPDSLQRQGCNQSPLEKDDSAGYQAQANNDRCETLLRNSSKLCYGTQVMDNRNKGEHEYIFSVFNDGGCVGNMTIEASISDNNFPTVTPGKCLSEIRPLCSAAATAHVFMFSILSTVSLMMLMG